jgi:hypothetical protein
MIRWPCRQTSTDSMDPEWNRQLMGLPEGPQACSTEGSVSFRAVLG